MPRPETTLETTGLTLAESKQLLPDLQRFVIEQQVVAYLDQQRACPHCGKNRPLKEPGVAPFRTLFGLVTVPNQRWSPCACQSPKEKTFRPLTTVLPKRTSPELRYLETKWAALASSSRTATLPHDVLPIDSKYSAVTVRSHPLQAAWRKEQALGAEPPLFLEDSPADRASLPIPDGPLAVGLDGGIARAEKDDRRADAQPVRGHRGQEYSWRPP